MKARYIGLILLGGGASALVAAWAATKKGEQTKTDVEEKILTGGVFRARLTGYWPYQKGLSDTARKMEGGTNDRKGKPLITLEQHLKDPVRYPYVSVAGDTDVWPYGQRIELDAWPGVVFRVVDTGGHFRGAGKVYRMVGYEPLDICVESSKTEKPNTATARIIRGDNFAKGVEVATAGMKGQKVEFTGEELAEVFAQMRRKS